MPEKLIAYKRLPLWTKDTMPEAVQRKHNTKVGTWGKITVLKGKLKFVELTEDGEEVASHVFEAGADNPMAQPQAWHRVEALTDDVEWFLEFYCEPKDYFPKKYNSNPVHSEVLEAMESLSPGKALDLGCGQGRNALFLAQHGFEVTAVDQNELALEILQSIVEQEDLEMTVGLYDINSANLKQSYDLIVSTVVLMFLQADRIPAIIRNMQDQTNLGGYNLIVCAMDTEDYPCQVPFSFTFKEGELADYYKDWELVKYNENPGHLHRRDENGNRIALRFATMLAKKK
ncbi:SAM-dependent methyltransferase TehB [Streptococcus xiaochunlingii]|uniref:SAM-dependent methyltransferase TehB n=1 Tax=Streptococcus TaxID=1301 RepID=UPI000779E084|nr:MULTISPECIES: SAM-dependent methyltransferase TehB [Streptococcus]AMP66979.1 tellurite resistance protein TehB [Streptococcus sp. A12]MDK8386373.1 SAM-dependent methyltransferase TehB [Streptococcus xiaochunlingii]MDK8777567.1 SAM-dependent methyltransferase TehB [Streptococcus xiaochunlingii]RSK12097.1 putative S-adenosyl-L-methionine-dependent methyltransferase TehB [Streptococcus australis]